MRGRIVKSALLLSIIVGLLATTFAMPSVSAQDTVLAVPCIVDTSLTPGSTFSVEITVDDVAAMFGYEFILHFDPAILTATGFASTTPFGDGAPVYIGEGYISSAASWPIPEYFGLTTDEPVPIGAVTFKVKDYGVSELELWYTVVVDIYGKLIEHIVDNGTFSNIWAEPFTVAVALDTGFVESRHFKMAREKDMYQTLTGQFKNVGTVSTPARVNFQVFDEMGARIADMTTAEVYIAPGDTLRLSRDLDVTGLALKPAVYLVVVRVQFLGFCTGWTGGYKGDVGAARTSMELTFKISQD